MEPFVVDIGTWYKHPNSHFTFRIIYSEIMGTDITPYWLEADPEGTEQRTNPLLGGGSIKEAVLTNQYQVVPMFGSFIDLRQPNIWVSVLFNGMEQPVNLCRTNQSVFGKWISNNALNKRDWQF